MAKDKTVIGITGKPIPKPKTAKQQYELEKKRRMEKHLGKNVGGYQYKSDVTPYYNPRARTFEEFMSVCEARVLSHKFPLSADERKTAERIGKMADSDAKPAKQTSAIKSARKIRKFDLSSIVKEAKEPKPTKEVLGKIAKAYSRKHRGVNVDTSHSEKSGNIRVNQLWVPPDKQGKGIGTRIMKGLGKYADKTGKKITLNQDPDPGKKEKLKKFYKSHGFEANKGKKKDFSTSDSYIRHPQSK